MFKLFSVYKPTVRPVMPLLNNFQPFVIAMPAGLHPLLKRRIFSALLCDLWGNKPTYTLSAQELSDLDSWMNNYSPEEAHTLVEGHNVVIGGRELSLLKRFLMTELKLARVGNNACYWQMLAELQLSIVQPTHLVKLSFCRE
ncbi:hypothetical protein GCM10028818_00890 [Spirosoma horti]